MSAISARGRGRFGSGSGGEAGGRGHLMAAIAAKGRGQGGGGDDGGDDWRNNWNDPFYGGCAADDLPDLPAWAEEEDLEWYREMRSLYQNLIDRADESAADASFYRKELNRRKADHAAEWRNRLTPTRMQLEEDERRHRALNQRYQRVLAKDPFAGRR